MGPVQLLLLSLLLSSGVLTQEESPESANPGCLKDATRFKPLRKYVYSYEAETSSGITGTADSRSGSKITCKVELEVPQLCRFVLRTMHCSLRETFGVDTKERAILKKSKNSEDFASAMSKNELKFSIQDGTKVKLYPEKDEPLNILNLKRGIISALLVPTETVENMKTIPMDTVYGKCDSEVEFKSRKGNVAEDISITRYLKGCDSFSPIRDHVSPIAIVKGLNTPLSALLKSTQFCHYNIDAKKRHIRDVVCSEKHLLLPSSNKSRYVVMTEVNQTLKLEDTPKITNKNFDGDALEEKGLALESTDAKLSRQGDAVLKTLQEMQKLAASQENQQRARLFYRFVSGLRSLHNSSLGLLVPKMMETSSSITVQALTQCGTPECYSAILQILRTGNVNPLVADLITYTLGLLPSPTPQRIREILNMAQYQPSRASFYGLSHSVTKFYNEKKIVTEEIADVADFMVSLLGTDCSGEDELTYLTLRAIGNMGAVMEKVKPSVKSSLKTCIRNEAASLSVQKAAIQAFRKMTITEEDRSALLKAFQEPDAPTDKRLAAYLLVMKNPSPSDLAKILRVLTKEKSEQVKSFVASHIANILDSEELGIEDLKSQVEEALKGNQLPTAKDFRKFSQNYQISKRVSVPGIDPISAKVEGNVLFDPNSYIPKETMLKTTLHAYGFNPSDVFELGLDGKGFEPTVEALFGENGFFPDTATKALYWVDGKVPEKVSKALFDYFGYLQDGKQDQDIAKGIILNLEKLIKELGSKQAPEGRAYLRILGEELGYMKLNDFKLLGSLILKSVKTLQTVPEMIAQAISKGVDRDLFVHYIFMDNEFELPTGAGLQLKFALSGIATPGARVAAKLHQKSMQADLIAKPSVAVEFVTHLGINMPEFAGSGVEINSNIFHESGIEAHVSVKAGQLKFSIPAPKSPVKLLSISDTLHLVSPAKTEEIPTLIENQKTSTSCKPFIPGLNFCTKVLYPNSTDAEAVPYFPLTGECRFEVELVSTGEVKEYSASANYELQREGNDQIDTLKFAVQAEGINQHEATLTFRYNRGKKILTSDVQIPDVGVDFGTNFRITDESISGKKAYTFVLDVNNKKITEVTLTGQIRYAGVEEATLRGSIAFPRLETELESEALVNYSPNKAYLQISSAATIHGNSISKRVLLRYDAEKVELEWNSSASAAVKKLSSAFPADFSDYPKTLEKHTNELLDQKVAHTDMTLRHIVSQFIVATNTWLQKASKDVPYAQTLQDKLSALQELNIQKLNLPVFTIPEELFLKSEGRIRYNFNKNSFVIDIPLPFAGKSSDEIRMPKTVKTPPLVVESMGISVPSQEYRIPTFTVPKSYPFRVPLLGKLEVSANVYSNYYNWTAAYTVTNSTTERATSVKATYNTNADSVLELLSYSVKGSGEASYNRNGFICAYENHLKHRVLTSVFKLSGRKNYEPVPVSNYTLSLTASSTLGPQLSFSSDIVSEKINNMNTNNVNMEGQLEVASVYAKSIYTLSTTYNEKRQVLEGKSNLKLESSYLQATNQISGRYSDGSFSITSVSDVQNELLKNTATLKFENSQLKMSSETNGRYQHTAGVNKLEIILSKKMAALRSEYQATYKQIQYFAVFAGSLNSQDLVFNTDISLTDQKNRAAHKSSLNVNRYGLASSATTNMQFSPLAIQSEMNAKLDTAGGSMSLSSSGRYGKNNAKFNVGGRVSLTEITLGSEYQSTVLGMDNKHVLNFRVNREGLKFSNNLQGSFKEIKLEYTNDLNIPGLSLAFVSKLDNSFSFDKFHKHVFDLQLEPSSLTAKLSNNLKYTKTEVSNKAELLLEPLNMNLGGNVRGAHGADEIRHTYTLTCAGLTADLKTDTVANVQGAAVSHRVHLDVAGLSSSVTMNTNCDSKPLRFSNVLRSTMAPFVITADVHTNANGKLVAVGEHTGDLYSKLLFKAEPLAFTFSHDYRGSTSHSLKSTGRYTTLLDNKVQMLFTPSEQSSSWKLKSQLNNNVYSQDFSTYNNAEKIGVELNGRALADLSVMDRSVILPLTSEEVNLIDLLGLRNSISEPQEFSISGFVKYDKNKDMHVISLPFLENLPVYFEKLRSTILSTLQPIQRYLKSVDIEQHVKRYKATLSKLPQDITDYMDKLDIKGKVSSMKNNFVAFTKDYRITSDDLQIMLEKAMDNLQEILSQLQIYLVKVEQYIKDCYEQYDIKALIAQLLDQIVDTMTALENKYQVRATVINIIEKLRVFFQQYDLNKIGSSTLAWIKNLDDEYRIAAKIQEKLESLKIQIQNIDLRSIVENLKQQIKAFDAKECLEKFKRSLPIEKINEILEQIKDFILNWIEEYELSEKISAFRGRMHKLIIKYEIDKQIYFLIDRMIELLKTYRIKETVQKLTIYLQNADVKSYFDKVVAFVDDVVKKVQTFDYEKMIKQVNKFLDMVIKKLKAFDYDQFVDDTNKRIREVTQKINEELRNLELPQKAEALKQYIRDFRTVISKYMEQLKDTKLAAVINWLRELIDSTTFANLKAKVNEHLEDLRERISEMDISQELQRCLQKISQFYNSVVIYISDQWNKASKKITALAEEYDLKNWAENIKQFVETGFKIPEIRAVIVTIPAFEVSLRSLREATFQTPEFIVPLTDLRIPSYEINIKRLKDMKIPMKFTTPEFKILNTFPIPSFTIDLIEVKLLIVRTIDKFMSAEFQFPSIDIYLKDLKMKDMPFSDISFPEIQMPQFQVPELLIPKLNLNELQIPNMKIPEFQLPHIPRTVTVPTFGKLSGAFRVTSPFFTLSTQAELRNTTTSANSPEFVTSISAQTTSKLDFLVFSATADSRLLAPDMKQLNLKNAMKVNHRFLKVDHTNEVVFLGTSVVGEAETRANLNTKKNSVELQNNLMVKLQRKIWMQSGMAYSHRLNIPQADFSSQADLINNMTTEVEAGYISFTSAGRGNWKWASPNFSDEGTHDSLATFKIEGPTITFSANNRINDKYLKVNQAMKYECHSLMFAVFQIQSEMESQRVGRSLLNVQGTGELLGMKVELTGSHNSRLHGRITGTVNNEFSFLANPSKIYLSTNNDGNMKISFPMKLTGKIDFLNNYGFALSSSVQQVNWQATGRFNQYRYSHNMSAGSNDDRIEGHIEMNGDANLDFLNIPLSIPQMQIPYTGIKTPQLKDYSLWEQLGLKELLKTTRQSFELNLNAQYEKNKDMHAIPLPLAKVHEVLNKNILLFNKHFEKGRNAALDFLTKSYNDAKTKLDKYKIQTSLNKIPRTLTIPGYTIPVVNIEVSPFTAEMPAFGFTLPKEISTRGFTVPIIGFSVPSYTVVVPSFELPVLHIPQDLRTLKLPRFRINSSANNILVPAMGNITYDFSFKSSVITLTANAGLFNQSDIVGHLGVSSSSVIEALQFKLDGSTSLTRKRGLKLATALSLSNNKYLGGNHDSTITLLKRMMEATVATNIEVDTPLLKMNFSQELSGNTKSKPTLSSGIKLMYDFNTLKYGTSAKGEIAHKFALESLTYYISVESSTTGGIDGVFYTGNAFSGSLDHEVNAYLNANGARSSLRFEAHSKADGLWLIEIKELLAVEASTRRIYAVWEHNGKNYARCTSRFTTTGTQRCKATLELAPWDVSADLQIQAIQPNPLLGMASVNEAVVVKISPANQKAGWKGEGQIHSLSLSHDMQLSNENSKAKFDISGSLEGYMDFLKVIKCPISEKSLWDILKLDVTTSADRKQYLNGSASLVYTKSEDGYFFPIPVNKLTDGFTVTIPGLHLKAPSPVLSTPEFSLPFTTLQVPAYTVDLRNIKIPQTLSTMPFDVHLPTLPKLRFPKVDVGANYITLEEYKMPFFEVTIPEYQITMSQFTLPKSVSFGSFSVDLDEVANKIADFEMPTITIPEQKIEIPPLKISLPAGIYIPSFGALTGSFKVVSPLYNVTWRTDLTNKKDSFEHSIDSTCSSTLQFLEYDLNVVSNYEYKEGVFVMKTTGSFSHRDLSANYQENLTISGFRGTEDTLSLDIISPTFTDVHVRYQENEWKSSGSISSPSAGTLAYIMERDNETLVARVYYQTQSAPQNDINILKGEISLKEPDQIEMKFNWNEDAAKDLLLGLKARVPKMTNAVYRYVNRYHKEHTGLEISAATLKMKNIMQNNAEKAYTFAANQIDELDAQLRTAANEASDKYQELKFKAKRLYRRAADQAEHFDYQRIKAELLNVLIDIIEQYHQKIKHVIDSATEFLKTTKFQVPGLSEKYSGAEIYLMTTEKAAKTADVCLSKLQEYFDALIAAINELEVRLPASETILRGRNVLDQIKEMLKDLQNKIRQTFATLQEADFAGRLKQLKQAVQQVFQKVEEMVRSLQSKTFEDIKVETQQLYKDAMASEFAQKLRSLTKDVKKYISQFKDFSQKTFQDLSKKLHQLLLYVKSLREEYFDPTTLGLSVKYYEVEEKVLGWLKNIIDLVVDWHNQRIGDLAGIATRLTEQVKEYVEIYSQEYYDLITDFEGKGKQKIMELSSAAQEKIRSWSAAAKRKIDEHNKQLKEKLREIYGQLSQSQEKLISEAKRLIDLTIENYSAFLQYLSELLRWLEQITAESIKPYVAVRRGELRIQVPMDWQAIYQMPQKSRQALRNKVEMTHILIQQGIEKGSKKWNEMQHFTNGQLDAEQVSPQEIMENIQQHMNT
ncbi:LOW QUALITY PROTEIN: apolipoprotein B-100 [Ammospiza nelsoni]|uniref:LOW QUALITY PROTEIN: apolipoprotein B-100 n=1 Tax=Ammospiza nelsoni TaxID=2857394 RepID=UPI00286C830A|nr:LOW QUALITY PROTEIN: apolipoprotein B-100 [Ammospiza nelsoni]